MALYTLLKNKCLWPRRQPGLEGPEEFRYDSRSSWLEMANR